MSTNSAASNTSPHNWHSTNSTSSSRATTRTCGCLHDAGIGGGALGWLKVCLCPIRLSIVNFSHIKVFLQDKEVQIIAKRPPKTIVPVRKRLPLAAQDIPSALIPRDQCAPNMKHSHTDAATPALSGKALGSSQQSAPWLSILHIGPHRQQPEIPDAIGPGIQPYHPQQLSIWLVPIRQQLSLWLLRQIFPDKGFVQPLSFQNACFHVPTRRSAGSAICPVCQFNNRGVVSFDSGCKQHSQHLTAQILLPPSAEKPPIRNRSMAANRRACITARDSL